MTIDAQKFPPLQFTAGKADSHPTHETILQRAAKAAERKAAVVKHSGCHTFRHSFAPHLHEGGYDIRPEYHGRASYAGQCNQCWADLGGGVWCRRICEHRPSGNTDVADAAGPLRTKRARHSGC